MQKKLLMCVFVLSFLGAGLAFAQDPPPPLPVDGCPDPGSCSTGDPLPPPPPPSLLACYGSDKLKDYLVGALKASADGKIHIKYGFIDEVTGEPYTPSTQMKSALDNAMGLWNAVSATTKIVFEAVGANENPNFKVSRTTDPVLAGGTGTTPPCIATNTHSGHVFYVDTYANMAAGNQTAAQTGFAHEVAEFLGIKHIDSTTFASVATGNFGTCSNPEFTTNQVTADDAAQAANCVRQAQAAFAAAQQSSGGGGGDPAPDYYPVVNYPCYEYWSGTDIYLRYWTGDGWGYAYLTTVYELISSTCM